jgi:O-antigen/teichoic acid export membrane protein
MGQPAATVAAIDAAIEASAGPAAANPANSRRLTLNFFVLSAGEFAAKLLTFAAFSYLARHLSASDYGALEFTLAVMVFFTLPVDLGLGSYGAREIAKNPAAARRLLHEITGIRALLAVCSFVVLALFVLVLPKDAAVKRLLLVYGLSLLANPFFLQWFFQAFDCMQWVAAASIVRQTAFAGFLFFCIKPQTPLFVVGLVECVSVAGVAVFCLYVVHWRMGFDLPWPKFRQRTLASHLTEAAPIGLTELAWAFMWYFGTVLLGLIFSDASLGWFGASHRALMALHTFVWLYFFNLLPSISRCVGLPNDCLLALIQRSLRFAAWSSGFAAFMITVFAREVLTILYGPHFAPAAATLSILAWILPIAMLSGHHRYILLAYGHQRRLLRCTATSAVVAVILGFALVPWFPGKGAATALLAANLVNFALVYHSVRQLIVTVPVWRQVYEPMLALSSATAVYLLIPFEHSWVAAAIGCAVYIAMLVCLEGRQALDLVKLAVRHPAADTA